VQRSTRRGGKRAGKASIGLETTRSGAMGAGKPLKKMGCAGKKTVAKCNLNTGIAEKDRRVHRGEATANKSRAKKRLLPQERSSVGTGKSK